MKSPLVKLFLIVFMVYACCAPARSVPPVVVTAGPAIFEGSVQGHVLAAGSNASIPGAKVWLVNATRDNTTYGATTADSSGHFYFVDVPPLGPGAFRLKAQKGGDTGTTPRFSVSPLENRTMDVYLRMKPAAIGISASRSYVVADGHDHIGITARVNDSMGRPVIEGYPVIFTAAGHPAGSLFGSIVPESAVTGNDGRATAEYGWVQEAGAASHTIIEASAGAGLNAGLAIDIRLPDTTPPETMLKASGEPDSVGGFISDVTVSLAASDPGGWGVNETFYRTGDSGWARYTGPFIISGEGGTTIYYYSTDRSGNVETPKSRVMVLHKK
jgi:hypothetical protein